MSALTQVSRKWVAMLAIAIFTATVLLVLWMLRSAPSGVPTIQGSVLLEPRPLPEIQLYTHKQEPFTRADFQNRWHLVTYGFTHCPDICPTTLLELAQFQRALDERDEYTDLSVWFYTVDPQRDTADMLASYVPWFHPSFGGLVPADQGQAKRFEESLGIVAFIEPGADPANYQVAHGLQVYLLNDRGELQAALHPTRERSGYLHYEVDRLMSDYLAIRQWRDQ